MASGAFLARGKIGGMTQDEMKQALSRLVEAEIGNLVAWGSQADGVTLTDVEDRV